LFGLARQAQAQSKSMKTIIKLILTIILLVLSTASIIEKKPFLDFIDKYKLFYIETSSMEPMVKKGSIIISKKSIIVEPGNVIIFQDPTKMSRYIVHRFITYDSENKLMITKGDNNNTSDPWLVSSDLIYGKMLFSVPFLGYVIKFTQKPLGILLFFILPLGYFLMTDLSVIGNTIKNTKIKKKEYENPWIIKDNSLGIESIALNTGKKSPVNHFMCLSVLKLECINWIKKSFNNMKRSIKSINKHNI
jgi:signal peptidase I